MSTPLIIVWFRRDLRMGDHPALTAAARRGQVLAVYVHESEEEGDWPTGAAGRWWLHHALVQLDASLRRYHSRLIVRAGAAITVLRELVHQTGATAVYWHRRYEPAAAQRDAQVKAALKRDGIETESFNGSLLREPWEVMTGQGKPYKVFTPYWRVCEQMPAPPAAFSEPSLRSPTRWPSSLTIEALELLPKVDWTGGLRENWTVNEAAAHERLRQFARGALDQYDEGRDRPGVDGTSRLSPYLHWGLLSPRQVWHAVVKQSRNRSSMQRHAACFLRELGWREFCHQLLYHFPDTPTQPLDARYAKFPWRADDAQLAAWQRGRTGYPLVDAGMRQLWHMGWMHNRVRMVVASFLVKHLLLPWQEGAKWFWDTLVDADLANNTFGWQWAAGSGADAAPYFRVFNPVLQGERHDPQGDYVRLWVPELAALPNKWIHQPFAAPIQVLRDAGVVLGRIYPEPIVEHAEARQRALAAWQRIK